ncbi:terminase TerL endonuclease subunit [Miltoncostaea marina]|uniref:terminase TerL endonuclease subunit n=1 Tax=Miltoncostaea marina TaxID=2843215 RepID=UPI001C3CA335|nr:terminase TerL endonuclease subunit [Miltoncostaea marina]
MTATTPNPAADWAERYWILPETGRPIVLRPWQRAALAAMFPPDGSPSPWETFLISTIKKAGKTTLNAVATGYAALTFAAPETAYVVANDEAQAQERVFTMIAAAFRAMGLERDGKVRITASEIVLVETGTRIVAIPADYAGEAGAIFGITSWTELWAFRHEGHVRLWEEMTPIPERRSLRIVDSYAGFTADAPVLEPLWERALAGERLEGDLPIFTNGRLWAFIDQGEEAQERAWRGRPEAAAAYYAEQKASLRPATFARLHLNQWQAGEQVFLTAEQWDACTATGLRPLARRGAPVGPGEEWTGRGEPVLSVGVDAATKRDCAAVVAVALADGWVRLVRHRIWTPTKAQPLDLEETIEAYLLQLAAGYRIGAVRYDPTQMARSAATLTKAGLPMIEWPQTTTNLTTATTDLYDLVRDRRIVVYADDELRAHVLNAVAIEGPRGWRLAKEKSSRKIDGAVALSFACVGASDAHRPATAHSYSTLPQPGSSLVVRRGDLVWRGRDAKRYIDKPPGPPSSGSLLSAGPVTPPRPPLSEGARRIVRDLQAGRRTSSDVLAEAEEGGR